MIDHLLPSLSIEMNGASGITIKCKLSQKYNLGEFTLNDNAQPVFISPWMQFEPSPMREERQKIAMEIIRRVTIHDEMMKELHRFEAVDKSLRSYIERIQKTQDTTFNMWKADRKRMGLPEDFSDITNWPPEMMANYP
jgi:hypothetical protein